MEQNAKQQAVESIKQAANILVTVSSNPSVDQLSAALGLTLMLSKLDKHTTAVFSGQIPRAINFLEPDKTLENNVDSLRDFIISLDKNKADKLRYKVEDDVVRIFITPYRTQITPDDFQFSQGDFNIDVVIALGVENREDLDNAIKAHGRILHDSTVLTINTGNSNSNLGVINWTDETASSLCEMLVSVSESFGSGLLDQQISTAYLTGIVAATERFSNSKTSPKVMTMSAQLMASGANQQLIANELQLDNRSAQPPTPAQATDEITEQEVDLRPSLPQMPQEPSVVNTANEVNPPPILPENDEQEVLPDSVKESLQDSGKTLKDLESEIAALSGSADVTTKENIPATQEFKLPPTQPDYKPPTEHSPFIKDVKGQGPKTDYGDKPLMGGTFNATSSEAHEDAQKQMTQDFNSPILHHSEEAEGAESFTHPTAQSPTIQPLDASLKPEGPIAPDIDAARDAVNNAMNNQPFNPAGKPIASIGSQPMPTEEASPQINIDDNGMVVMPENNSVIPPTQPDENEPTVIL